MLEKTIIDHFKKDKFAVLCGIELTAAKDGMAKGVMKVEDRHLNTLGILQGGALFTLCDTVFSAAANSRGRISVSLDAKITYIRPGLIGTTLTATAQEESCNRRTASYIVKVFDQEDRKIAVFTGIAFRKDEEIIFNK